MGYAKEILSLVADQLVGDDDYFTVKRLGNGFISLSGRFRVKPKNAKGGEKVIETQDELPDMSKPKKSVKAKFSECKSKNPMRCRYHGAIYATNALKAILANHGIAADDVSVKRIDEGTYDFYVKIPEDKVGAVKEDLKKFYENNELEPLSAEYDKNGYYSVMYEAEEELDPDEQAEVETLKVDYDNTKKSVEELSTLGMSLSPDDAKFLNDELDAQNKTAEEMAEIISMLGADDTDDGWDDGWGNDGKVVPKPEGGLPSLPELPENLDDLTHVDVYLGGSTGPTLWQDKNGNKFIVKKGGMAGGDPEGHVTNEYYGLKAYRAMGVFCPDAKLLKDKNGNTVLIENFIEGKSLGEYLDTCDAAEFQAMKEQIKDTTFADVLLGNWDAAGTPDGTAGDYPNMLVVDGRICRIDPGGWGKYRAQGALKKKEDWEDGYPNEIFSMKKVGTTRDFIKDLSTYDLVNQIAQKDLTGLIAVLPEEDRKVMQKRIYECRELAETGRNYVEDGGYTKESADTVLWFSLQIAKGGGREALNYGEFDFDSLEYNSMKEPSKIGDKDIERNDALSQLYYEKTVGIKESIAMLSKSKKVDFYVIGEEIAKAIKTINYYAGESGSNLMHGLAKQFYDAEIDGVLNRVKDLQEVKKQIIADGDGFLTMQHSMLVDSFLEQLKKIEKVKEAGKPQKIQEFNAPLDKDMEPFYLNPSEKAMEKVASLRKRLVELNNEAAKQKDKNTLFSGMTPMSIIDTLCVMDNESTGLEASYKVVSKAMESQGLETWEVSDTFQYAHFMKLAELSAMGYDVESLEEKEKKINKNLSIHVVPTTSNGYVYCGYSTGDSDLKGTYESFSKTIKYIKEHPSEWESFRRSHLAMKSVQSAIFANTKFKDCDRGHVMVKRKLQRLIEKVYKIQEGKYNLFPTGTSESASYGKSSYDQPLEESYSDAMIALAKVPVSRLTGLFCWNDAFGHASEGEFGVNLSNIPLYCLRESEMSYDENRYKPYFDFVRNNPSMSKQNTHVADLKNDA